MSITFRWKSEYTVDHGVIDEEHRQLLELANRVFDFYDAAHQVEEIKGAVRDLYKYIEHHFRKEQALMEAIDYPRLSIQVEAHRQIVHGLNALLRKHSSIEDLLLELRRAILDWVIHHIMEEDRRIGEYIRANVAAKS